MLFFSYQRPSFCPIHNMTKSIHDSIPADILSRGVDCGSVALVESSDGFILLIRRAKKLRTFPNIWVPPGGHIEQNETVSLKIPSSEQNLPVLPAFFSDS